MIEFRVTWVSERGNVCTDTGRATQQKIDEWNAAIKRAVEEDIPGLEIRIPTDGDGDYSDGTIRAILVKEVVPIVKRPEDW